MGQISHNDDGDELQQHWTAVEEGIRNGLSNIRNWVSAERLAQNLDAERKLAAVTSRINLFLDETQKHIEEVFQDARKKLMDPSTRIVKRLDKKDAQIEDLRSKLQQRTSELTACRSHGERLTNQLREFSDQINALKRENAILQEAAAWSKEISSIKPVRP